MDTKTIELNADERRVLVNLIDLAVKHPTEGGLAVSGAARYLAEKFADDPVPSEEEDAPAPVEVEEVAE
tara:strand:+ start:1615 stop:1821 length:207 start_codon:yes stop_codon:yes gene_type:complete